MTNLVFRFATVQGQHVHWLLRRNCSVTPLQLLWTYVSLCVVSLGIGVFFWFQGATLVIPFASLELIAVGLAFLVYARHSTDRERISLQENRLVVELECAGKLERAEFQRGWVKVEPRADDSSLIELSERGRTIRVGRYIRPELRPQLAKEIRSALRAA
ncbi:COG5488 Integral membrane protein [Comamonadaceae bacterium]